MRTIEYIHGRIKAMDLKDETFKRKFGTKKEVNELVNILKDDESLDYIVSGFYDGTTWLVAVTSLRLLFIDKGMLFGVKQKEVMLDKINSINFKKGLLLAKLFIEDGSGKTLIIDSIDKDDLLPFVNILNENINVFKSNLYKRSINENTSEDKNNSKEDFIKQLKDLATLRNEGILTEEEFIIAKQKLISM